MKAGDLEIKFQITSRFILQLQCLWVAVLCVSCTGAAGGPGGGGGGSSSNAILSSLQAVHDQLRESTRVVDINALSFPMSAPTHAFVVDPFAAPAFGSDWTTPLILDPITLATSISPRDWLALQFEASAKSSANQPINVFGRLRASFGLLCAMSVGYQFIGASINSTTGYPELGTRSLTLSSTLKSSMNSNCGIDISTVPDGTVVQVTVAAATGLYDFRVSFDVFDQVFYFRKTALEINILGAENLAAGNHARAAVAWDLGTNVLRAEYVAVPTSSGNPASSSVIVNRLHYDRPSDQILVHSYAGGASAGVSDGEKFTLAGKPRTGDASSLSFRSASVGTNAKFEACILKAGNTPTNDGIRCVASQTRINGADVDTAITSIDTALYNDRNTVWNWSDATHGVDGSEGVSFIGTADLATAPYIK